MRPSEFSQPHFILYAYCNRSDHILPGIPPLHLVHKPQNHWFTITEAYIQVTQGQGLCSIVKYICYLYFFKQGSMIIPNKPACLSPAR